jgi:hypothetical protein
MKKYNGYEDNSHFIAAESTRDEMIEMLNGKNIDFKMLRVLSFILERELTLLDDEIERSE